MRAWLRRRWNEIVYGSPSGPAIMVDWDRQVITYLDMSPRLVVRLERWRARGEQYRPTSTP